MPIKSFFYEFNTHNFKVSLSFGGGEGVVGERLKTKTARYDPEGQARPTIFF